MPATPARTRGPQPGASTPQRTPNPAPQRTPRRARHRRITRRRKIGRAFGILTVLLLVAGTTLATLAYHDLSGNITSRDVTEALGTDRPAALTPTTQGHKPLNILLIGSDDRTGSGIGGDTPGLSDTTLVVHVNAARTTATAVSIPRDSMIDRPDCRTPDGDTAPATPQVMFNTAYAVGGPGCTMRTVEQLTGLRLDHYVLVNLAGFTDMVDALGGVPICVPRTIDDPIGKIHLRAGTYTATGKQALDYVRERHVSSANGDLGRMKRQQVFLSAMAHKVLDTGTLTNPTRLYPFLSAATSSLTTDPDLASLHRLAGLAMQMRNLKPARIRFLSIPTQPYPADPNRLQWASEAAQVWQALRHDRPLPATVRPEVTTARTAPTTTGSTSGPAEQGDARNRPADDNGLCT